MPPAGARAGGPERLWHGVLMLVLTLLLGLARPAWAACGVVPDNYIITAGGSGVLNVNGFNYVNGFLVWGLGPSVTSTGARSFFAPTDFPSLPDLSSESGVTKLNNLSIAGNSTYTFASGTYLINGATMGSNATVVLSGTTRLYIQGTVSIGSGLRFNTAGPTANAAIFLYPNANLSIGNNATFRGLIYGPGGGNNVSIGSGASFTGMIAVNSSVAINGGNYTLSSSDLSALGAITTCYDGTRPTLTGTSQDCGAQSTVRLTFSEPVNEASAETVGNYSLPGISISSATRSSDGLTVTLALASPLTSSKTLTVSNVTDLAGNAIVAGSTIALTPLPLYAGLYGEYYSQNGNRGSVHAFTGTRATRVDEMINFDWATSAPGVGSTPADGFSVRWSGVIKAPTTGTYGFATGTDDGVRLWVDGNQLINNWSDHSYTVNASSTRISATAGEYLPLTMEYYENATDAVAKLGWQQPGQSGTNYPLLDKSYLFNCTASAHQLTGFTLASASSSGSTCSPLAFTLTALDIDGTPFTSYTGSVTLSTSSGRGTWALGSPTPGGALVNNGNGSATYTFVAADAGVVQLTLAHSLAQDVTVSVSADGFSASSGTVAFRDNAFVWAEDLSNRVTGSDIAVAGRPHDLTLSLIKRDPSTGSCGVATDYSGSRSLKLWRTDSGGSWTAPTVVTPALSIPSAQPAANNLTLTFSAGVASLNLGSTDIGRYSLNARDDTLSAAATVVSGSSNTLTVRPFALLVQGISSGGTANPNGSAATDTVLAAAGANFSATVGAYAWSSAMLSNGADPGNTGNPSASATAAALTAGGRTASFASALTLAPLAGSQTPAGGVLGSLNNGNLAAGSFSGGQATPGNLQYTEVGSFLLNTSGVVSNFLGSGLALDAIVLNASGAQNARIGRFKPAGFSVSAASLSHRSSLSCSPASAFTYLGEPFRFSFTLTARNALGTTTANYTGSFAKLGLGTPANFNLAGLGGSTVFSTTAPARLTLGSSTGSWSNGVASGVTLSATAERGSTPDGPFDVVFGVAPVDSDGVTVLSPDLDTDSPANGADRATLGSVALRLGRLRLMNAIGAQNRPLNLPLVGQYWSGSDWTENTLDSCTSVPVTALNFGNLRKGLTVADTNLATAAASLTLTAGRSQVPLAAPLAGRSGTFDVGLSLGSTATDSTCLQPWSPGLGDQALAGAGLAHLRGAWCGSSLDKDPSARASFGLFKGAETTLYQRENY